VSLERLGSAPDRDRAIRLRSLLFCPGNRPDMLAKLGAIGADAVAIDLEDGVPPDAKDGARQIAREATIALAASDPHQQVFIRVNSTGSPWIEGDLAEALDPAATGIILPKLEHLDQLEWAAGKLDGAGLRRGMILGGLETAAGIENAPGLAHPSLGGVYFGAEDFIADVGGQRTASGHEVTYARSRAIMAARIIGVSALDQVVVQVKDRDRFLAEAVTARQLGYTGKVCLHPAQVPLAHQVFTPSDEEVDHSRRLLAAAAEARRGGRGVILFEGQMVDLPVVRHAERVLAQAGITHEEREP
jgi:citrate lyase subunit beta / citryl-CoA lyase